jgi:hypothetical protein
MATMSAPAKMAGTVGVAQHLRHGRGRHAGVPGHVDDRDPFLSRRLRHSTSSLDPAFTELTTYLRDNRTVPFMDQLWPNAKVQQTMLSGLQEIFSGQSTPDKVLAAMDADYKAGA